MAVKKRDHDLEEIVVRVNRCAKVVKGGKRFSFSALVVVGNRNGQVGFGYGKANDVPFSVEKAIKEARQSVVNITLKGTTIPHQVVGKYSASEILLKPACEGTGIKAGAAARAVLELAGIKDVLTKVSGSRNPINVVRATMICLQAIRSKAAIELSRGLHPHTAAQEAAPAVVPAPAQTPATPT